MKVLLALTVLGGLFAMTPVALFLFSRWRLRRHLRIRPGVASAAPTGWLVSCSAPACLHRRLRRLAALARASTAGNALLAPLAGEVEQQALVLEAHLVAVARAGRAGAHARRALGHEVGRLEGLAVRLASSAGTGDLADRRADPIGQLGERLDALDAARAELRLVEARAVHP